MLPSILLALTPIVLLASLGFFLGKHTDYLDAPQIGNLVSNIGMPALLLTSVLSMNMEIYSMAKIIMASILILASMSLITLAFLKLTGQSIRFYLSPLVNPNAGNLGIPIAFALFAEPGLAVAVVVSSVVQISHFSLGVGVMSGEYRPKQLLKNGPVIALLIGIIMLSLSIQLPEAITNTLTMMSQITLPMMLLLLGNSLSKLTIKDKGKLKSVIAFSIYRPVMGCLVAFAITCLLPLTPLEKMVLIILNAMPVAVISYMLATSYKGPKEEIALMILLSLPISLIICGLLGWLALQAT
ncbi:AEC family transporter [Marinomonas sp. THO17]|uniref:AEC family transporter n=1 Tax=Marinomonas sp. THO17 TaxID=3149048 RepID=UPI00336BE462